MKRLVVIGSGNVAEALVRAIRASSAGAELAQVYARDPVRGRGIARPAAAPWTNVPDELAAADIYLIAVSDDAIGAVSAGLDFGDAVVAHTAGSVPWETLAPRIRNRGIFYPLQTFTAGRPVDFRQVPLFVTGENERTVNELMELGEVLSDRVAETTPEQLRQMHLAAVFACNFPNRLYAVAQQLLADQGLAPDVLDPLIAETTAKALDSPSAADVQTGPARRGDAETMRRHLDLLADHPEWQTIYKAISDDIWQTSKKK